MAEPDYILDISMDKLEQGKFLLDDDENITVRTLARGNFTPSGLTTSGLVTVVSVGTSSVKLPSSPLTSRNTISIHNKDTSATLYIGFSSSVTADDTSTGGWEVAPGNFFNTDITPSVEIWGISTTTITVKVLELA